MERPAKETEEADSAHMGIKTAHLDNVKLYWLYADVIQLCYLDHTHINFPSQASSNESKMTISEHSSIFKMQKKKFHQTHKRLSFFLFTPLKFKDYNISSVNCLNIREVTYLRKYTHRKYCSGSTARY